MEASVLLSRPDEVGGRCGQPGDGSRQDFGRVMDASTLGKLLVSGPDAGKFLDVIYTGKISTLKPGRCRYGLMCNENGFLMDDGVVARMSDDSFLCHTTTGGADHVHSWMENGCNASGGIGRSMSSISPSNSLKLSSPAPIRGGCLKR